MSPFHSFSKGRRLVKSMEESGGILKEILLPLAVDCVLATTAAAISIYAQYSKKIQSNFVNF